MQTRVYLVRDPPELPGTRRGQNVRLFLRLIIYNVDLYNRFAQGSKTSFHQVYNKK
jgi:hypothetical protein